MMMYAQTELINGWVNSNELVMNALLLKFNKSLKKITVSKSYSAEDLGHLIAHSFDVRDKVVGLTDKLGKFYDLEHVSKNLPNFKN